MAIRSTPEIPVRPSEPSEFHVGSRLRPIHYWSAFGAACVAIQIYVYGSWLLSGDVYPQRTGSDPVPVGVQAAAWIMQATSVLAVVALIVYVWRRSRREHALAWDALIAIGFTAAYWQDPIINYFRPVYFYNSYLINVGAWTSHIPGWLSPHAGNLPEPLFMILPIFTCLFVVFGIAFCAMARRRAADLARHRASWPLRHRGSGFRDLQYLYGSRLPADAAFRLCRRGQSAVVVRWAQLPVSALRGSRCRDQLLGGRYGSVNARPQRAVGHRARRRPTLGSRMALRHSCVCWRLWAWATLFLFSPTSCTSPSAFTSIRCRSIRAT